MKVLVAGAAGQLGVDVVAATEVAGDEVVALDRGGLDLTDAAQVGEVVAAHAPDAVINCAAFTAVDACETEVETAFAVNADGVRHLALACAAQGAHLVHVSTDYVFDGNSDRPYREDDETNPASVYGKSKLAGEHAARDALGDAATIVRTSWVCGEHGNNMVKLVRRLAPAGNRLAFVDDQRGHPSFTADLAPALRALAERQPGGVVHLTNAGAVSWYEFVADILEASGFDRDLVRPISTVDLDPPRPAPRPANSVLANDRWVALGMEPLRHYRAPLADLVARLDAD
ncbi:MAG: dTDP-4-dehydrorhamnose reductase [Ilumatobacter sp.]|jgi:dTDP-4-dehydrorhamnose reductase|uniref:dTDP-4-dehydrorhamnose reductase n=1 Tax=Ilumatobacter sp. TaxID=1967498 RepID=UPI00391CF7F3